MKRVFLMMMDILMTPVASFDLSPRDLKQLLVLN